MKRSIFLDFACKRYINLACMFCMFFARTLFRNRKKTNQGQLP